MKYFCVIYNKKEYYWYPFITNEVVVIDPRTDVTICEKYDQGKYNARPIVNLIRFLGSKNEEYDPRIVDHGIRVYKRKKETKGISHGKDGDVMFIFFETRELHEY